MGAVVTIPLTFAVGLLTTRPSDVVYCVKWILSYVYIAVDKRWGLGGRFDLYDLDAVEDAEKVNFIDPRSEYDLESPATSSHLHNAQDEVFFWGVNSKDESLVVSIKRLGDQLADASVQLQLASGKSYELQQQAGVEQASSDQTVYSCGGLQVHFERPMRRWRLFYNGFLREKDQKLQGEGKPVNVKFALTWRASSDVFDFSADIPTSLLATTLATIKWSRLQPPLKRLREALNLYSQPGTMHGIVTVEDEVAEHEIYLFGQRLRFLDDPSFLKEIRYRHFLGYNPKNGRYINLGIMSRPKLSKTVCFGFVVQSDSEIWPVTAVTLPDSDSTKAESEIIVRLHADRKYELKISTSADTSEKDFSLRNIEYVLNGRNGMGILLERQRSKTTSKVDTNVSVLKSPTVVPLAVPFTEEICQISDITGGKGSSLGILTHFSKKIQTFIVPSGFVVTTASYQDFTTAHILSKVQMLEDVLYGNKPGDVKEECEKVSEEIVRTEFPEKVSSSIEASLRQVFGDKLLQKKFAVRSSATGEDTEQMSAAGQMDTFLGVRGVEEVLQSVKKCWASQFSYIAVQYKRRYGQVLNSPMAVVVQEMVPCDRAGVLFTCDPLTADPTRLTLTANYGLGESVVSGSEEPDTITLKRSADDQLSIVSTSIGAKSRRIIVREDEGTTLEDVPEEERNSCCLSEAMSLRLAQLAVRIEKLYRSSRDIEWGFCNNNLYIFQSRPITSGSTESDFEIDHEFDGTLRVENEYFSISNVGEVMPGAYTPLGMALFTRVMSASFQKDNPTQYEMSRTSKYYQTGMMMSHSHAMFNIGDILRGTDNDNANTITQSTLIAFFGRILDDPELNELIRERFEGCRRSMSLTIIPKIIKMLLFSGQRLKRTLKEYAGFRIPVERYNSSTELFEALLRSSHKHWEAFRCHMVCTQGSSIWNMILISILAKAQGGFDDTVYGDFSKLLTTKGEVESADVPSAIQSLAFHISKEIDPQEFKKKDPQEALEWLESTSTIASEKFKLFLEKHGHRALKEFDVRTVTWGTNPASLVKLLQNLVGNVSKDADDKKQDDTYEVLSQLHVPLGFWSKLTLRLLLPFSRRAVQQREQSKSLIIKCVDVWRKGYCELARKMVSEGRIPEVDLLFFFTTEDIRELLETRSPKVIARAYQRRRRYPILDKYMFPEIMKGVPKPINDDDCPIISNEVNFSMKGIPVSQGFAKGFVRVALTLEEAASLKPGEILLTHGTDIGWTPYFPTLAGVVTELGGLISHGAVVSREYGIPCIAGLHGATRQFQTGDYVLLDGNKGILQKIPEPEKS